MQQLSILIMLILTLIPVRVQAVYQAEDPYIRPFVIIPVGVGNLPDDTTIIQRVNTALDEIQVWVTGRTGLPFTFAAPEILHSTQDEAWFHTDSEGSVTGFQFGAVEQELQAAGYSGLCFEGYITLVWVATTMDANGGHAAGAHCGEVIMTSPNWLPGFGASVAGYAGMGQWNLDAVLSNGVSASCLRAHPPGTADALCSRGFQIGTIIHEIGHAVGLGHHCDTGQQHPNFPCDTIMQDLSQYPQGGFSGGELDVLGASVALYSQLRREDPVAVIVDNLPTLEAPFFGDNFDGMELNPHWRWISSESGAAYTFIQRSGFLRLLVPGGGYDLYPGQGFTNAPRIVTPLNGDFILTTYLEADPAVSYQGAGLVILYNEMNFVRLERERHGVSMTYNQDGDYRSIPAVDIISGGVYLQLVKTGSTFVGSASIDGMNWFEVGRIELFATTTPLAGLILINNWQNNSFFADFDWIKIEVR